MINPNFPYDWYWQADDGMVYSSSKLTLVDMTNPQFVEWLASGGKTTRWPEDLNGKQTLDELFLVIEPYGLVVGGLANIKAKLKINIDLAAETERLKYITPGTGQAMTYQQKVSEALAFKAATDPQTSDYPMLSSEVGITAETVGDVADVVLAAFAQWKQIGAAIESIRLGAKRDIDAAEDEAVARAVVDAIEWPQPAL